jgi:hypothetical protein
MLRWSDLPWAPNAGTLRQFAALCSILLFGLAIVFREQHVLVSALTASALVFPLCALIFPALVRTIFVAWFVLAFPVGWLVSHTILAAIFFGIFTPLGWLFRSIGRDPLALRQASGRETYWTTKPAVIDTSRYLRQF